MTKYPELDPEAIGRRLAALREEHGVTQRFLGRTVDLTEATLSNAEIGKTIPQTQTLYKLARFFGVPIEYILTGEAPQAAQHFVSDKVLKTVEEYLASSFGFRVSDTTAARLRDPALWACLALEEVDIEVVHLTRSLLEHAELVVGRAREAANGDRLRHVR